MQNIFELEIKAEQKAANCSFDLQEYMITNLRDQCLGNRMCEFEFKHHSTINIVNNQACLDLVKNHYVQYSCHKEPTQMKKDQVIALTSVAICIIFSNWFYMKMREFRRMNFLGHKMWDVRNCTASDFSIEMPIDKEMWQSFKKEQKNDSSIEFHR